MLFSSLTFLFYFLPIFLIVYYLLPQQKAFRNVWFLIGSLVFYFWGEQAYILVLICSILGNYALGLGLDQLKAKQKKALLLCGLVFNLGLLIYFKYALLLTESLGSMLTIDWEGTNWGSHIFAIYLPLGISFFTFQGISYIIDVYRGEVKAEKNVIDLACYISMFPQLIAGPIVRYQHISAQLKSRVLQSKQISFGVVLFIIGLSYKVLLANTLGLMVDKIYALPLGQLTTPLAWAASLGYTYQIYFDFCGYSTIAVGLGLMLGFRIPYNFNFPLIAGSVTEFWQRWHITLTVWFKDYLYIPLGGNRKGRIRTYINLLTVFIICGIWHGAAWNFLLWGLYNGFFLVIERLWLKQVLAKLPRLFGIVYNFIVFALGLLIFKLNSFEQALVVLKSCLGFEPDAPIKYWQLSEIADPIIIIAFVFSIFLATPLLNRLLFFGENRSMTLARLDKMPQNRLQNFWYLLIAICFIICVLLILSQSYNPFIYFRF